ncbi:MAG: hypothetical protein AB1705_22730, partial [Verrucomicrobiota bacterium]
MGNRTNQSSTLTGILSTNFSYLANDWLSVDGYDSNGNTTNSTKGVDTYDYENRLTVRTTGNTTIELLYDGDGNRVRKRVTVGTNVTTTWYVVDTKNLTGYAQVLEEHVKVNDGAVTLDRFYTVGLDLISQTLDSQPSWYGYDGHGSVRFLTDSNGTVTDTYDYDAYGNLIASTGTTSNRYRYTGEQWDEDLEFYYLRARYSNPATG